MKCAAALALVLVTLAACRTAGDPIAPPASAIRGRIDGVDSFENAARVQVYGLDGEGAITRAPFESLRIDHLGRFSTRVLAPGRYRLVYRSGSAPPSILSLRAPYEPVAVLHPMVEAGLVELRVSAAGSLPLDCRITSEARVEGVADVREFFCGSVTPATVRGMRPGRWRLDVPELGATTEVDVPFGSPERELVVDPPAVGDGGVVTGQVRRLDGQPASWCIVSARPLVESGESATRWGRYSVVGADGTYRIVGIPPGPSLVRVETREVPANILPAPHVVPIQPSEVVELSFVVEP